MDEKFERACEMLFDWLNDNNMVRQSDCLFYCEENHLNYDCLYDFVCEHEDEFVFERIRWTEICNKKGLTISSFYDII